MTTSIKPCPCGGFMSPQNECSRCSPESELLRNTAYAGPYWGDPESQTKKIMTNPEKLKIAIDALESIVFGEMTLPPNATSEDDLKALHARKAWAFISIAGAALSEINQK